MLKTAGDLLFLSTFPVHFPLRYESGPAGNADVRGSAESQGLMWEKMKCLKIKAHCSESDVEKDFHLD